MVLKWLYFPPYPGLQHSQRPHPMAHPIKARPHLFPSSVATVQELQQKSICKSCSQPSSECKLLAPVHFALQSCTTWATWTYKGLHPHSTHDHAKSTPSNPSHQTCDSPDLKNQIDKTSLLHNHPGNLLHRRHTLHVGHRLSCSTESFHSGTLQCAQPAGIT